METMRINPQAEAVERLPWNKPEIQRLIVNLDTEFRGDSVEDGDGLGFAGTDFAGTG